MRPLSSRDVTLPRLPPSHRFRPDDDYEEEEEIFYVTLELGNVEPALIPSCDSYHLVVSTFSARRAVVYSILGPGYIDVISTAGWDGAQGSARDVGSELLFSAAEHSSEHGVSFMESTRQRIYFREVRLEEKAKAKAATCQLVLDRITGKLAPLPRRRRTRKMEVVPEDY
ncbi:hypothetical protein ARMGADRAFT_1089495 [Armillaria gallica]|uniref:Uncharacterized protein n=1 Tax=Armillaria gallica TaxID=47427 RepID=A0A2H3CVZ0_ARMGA|nr:hypothetical protein ARMGADRAFT_1089495 [Armillaria gallica]